MALPAIAAVRKTQKILPHKTDLAQYLKCRRLVDLLSLKRTINNSNILILIQKKQIS